MLGGVDAQAHVIGKAEGADVQRCAVRVGHPVPVHIHQGLHRLGKVLDGDLGDAQAVGGILKAGGVAIGTEQLDSTVGGAVCLHALKNFLRIVEHHSGGVQRQRRIGHNARVMPALAGGVIHQEHMVGEDLAKAELALIGGLGLGGSGAGELDIQHSRSLLCRDHLPRAHIPSTPLSHKTGGRAGVSGHFCKRQQSLLFHYTAVNR